MDYEKLYKEARERARGLYDFYKNGKTKGRVFIDIFPELKEDEDERMRNAAIDACKYMVDNFENSTKQYEDAIVWLEKQAESKPTLTWEDIDKLEDIINQVHSENPNGISAENFGMEVIERFMENTPNKKQKRAERSEDEGEKIRKGIIKSIMDLNTDWLEIHGVTKKNALAWLEKQGTSYTKRDVDDAYLKGISLAKNEIEKQYEADYQIRKDIATFIFNYGGDIKDRAKWMNYLGIKISFIEKQGEQKPAEWSENDKKIRSAIYRYLDWLDGKKDCAPQEEYTVRDMKIWLTDLLYPNIKAEKELVEQKSIKWSEEDEKMLNRIICDIESIKEEVVYSKTICNEEIDWLKHLKQRIGE